MDSLPPGERGIIGLPVLIAFQALRWTADGAFEIGPEPRTDAAGASLWFDGLAPVVRLQYQGRPLDFLLDTGNSAGTQLWERFAREFPDLVRERGVKGKEFLAQIGGAGDRDVVTLPEIRLGIGALDAVLRPAHIFSRPVGNDRHHGNLGLDLLGQAHEVVVDFRSMTVRLR